MKLEANKTRSKKTTWGDNIEKWTDGGLEAVRERDRRRKLTVLQTDYALLGEIDVYKVCSYSFNLERNFIKSSYTTVYYLHSLYLLDQS